LPCFQVVVGCEPTIAPVGRSSKAKGRRTPHPKQAQPLPRSGCEPIEDAEV